MKVLLACLILLASTVVPADAIARSGFISRKDNYLVDGKGDRFEFRGVMLEGWLHWNGPLWNAGLASEKSIRKRLEDTIGSDGLKKFESRLYDEFITDADFAKISELGFNSVRVAINHTILEEDQDPFKYKQSGWQLLDRVLAMAEKHGVYVILDLHSAPGGQSGVFVNDPDKIKLWQSEENKKRTLALWKEIAKRYKDRKIIAALDLLNEPDFAGLIPFYKELIKEIREVDQNHLLILSGCGIASSNLNIFDSALDQNSALAFHTYNFLSDKVPAKKIFSYGKLSRKLNLPVINTEFGAHKKTWTESVRVLLEKKQNNISGWIFWPWKRTPSLAPDRFRALMEIKADGSWMRLSAYVGSPFGKLGKPGAEAANKALDEFLKASKIDNCSLNQGTYRALGLSTDIGSEKVRN